MKCQKCGTENPSKNNFCGTCGEQLKGALFCKHCGKELPQKSRFCIYCGVKVGSGVSPGRYPDASHPDNVEDTVSTAGASTRRHYTHQAIRKKGKSIKFSGRGGSHKHAARSKLLRYSMTAVSVLTVGAVLIMTLTSWTRPTSSSSNGTGSDIVWASDVQRIASNFNCPCGECGVARLDICTCDIAGGANEAKSYIQQLLNQGIPDDEVITRVEERYGNRIL